MTDREDKNIIQPAFYRKRDDEEVALDKGKIFTIRLNAKEHALLKEDMKSLHCNSEGTVLKKLAEAGRNVLHQTLGAKILAWISDPSRRRRED